MKLLTSDRPRPGPDCARLRIAALEFLEDARLVLARHADAGIGDDERDALAARAVRRGVTVPPAGVNLIAFEIEVEERLLQAPLVGR